MFAGDVCICRHNQTALVNFAGDAAQVAIFCLNSEENIRIILGLVTTVTGLAENLGARCAGGDNVIAATGGKSAAKEDDKEAFFQSSVFHVNFVSANLISILKVIGLNFLI